MLHCVRDCRFAQRVWAGFHGLPLAGVLASSFPELLEVLVVSWQIWKQQCEVLLGQGWVCPIAVHLATLSLLQVVCSTAGKSSASARSSWWVVWQFPPSGYVALNVDGSSLATRVRVDTVASFAMIVASGLQALLLLLVTRRFCRLNFGQFFRFSAFVRTWVIAVLCCGRTRSWLLSLLRRLVRG